MDTQSVTNVAPPNREREHETGKKSGGSVFLRQRLQKMGVFGALILLMIVSSVVSPQFLSVANVLNIVQQISIVGILSLGMTFVILTAGIDLSVGAVLALSSVLAAIFVNYFGLPLGLLLTIGVGALFGGINALGIVKGRIQPFIMTLATMAIGTGMAFIFSNGAPVAVRSAGLVELGVGRVLGIPTPGIILVILALVAAFVLGKTVFGRSIYAVGSNAEAARLSGIRVGGITGSVYVLSGVTAAIGGALYAAQFAAGSATAGGNIALDAIAATVIGGTSLFGGLGTISGTFLGAAILGVLSNVLNLTGVQTYIQEVAKGLIIVAAILIQQRVSGRKE